MSPRESFHDQVARPSYTLLPKATSGLWKDQIPTSLEPRGSVKSHRQKTNMNQVALTLKQIAGGLMGKFGQKQPPKGPKAYKVPKLPTDPSAMSVLGMTPPERPPAVMAPTGPKMSPMTAPNGSTSSYLPSNTGSGSKVRVTVFQDYFLCSVLTTRTAPEPKFTTSRSPKEEGQAESFRS